MGRHAPPRPPRWDIALAGGITVLAVGEVVFNPAMAPWPAALVCGVGMAATVAYRRIAPLAAAVVATLLGILVVAAGVPLDEPIVELLVVVVLAYSLASYAPPRHAVAGLVTLACGGVLQTVVSGEELGNFLFGFIFFAAMGLMGNQVRRRTARAVGLERQAMLAAQELDESDRRSRADERLRIAREVHDVVSHSISVMVVQAGAAEQVAPTDPERSVEAMRTIQRTGREAMAEMSRMLGVLRGGGEDLGLAPQPGIRDLPALLDTGRTVGLDVALEVGGEPRTMAAGVELAVYRIVQEALTNTLKHSGPVHVTVRLIYTATDLEVTVVDDGTGGLADELSGGHGLVGLSERVALYTGSLTAGASPGGGYGLRATFPLVDP
ncbi:sensor histidine kinase [Cellulomonas sp. URHE0023]|uniref:sensor histidine kinase n=1 Tax=Cellulomonas sp. URHE0023 TaxID=1380354 RepID=UPI0006921CCA|nr:sensor histidine kinase [Cellulomonas sp. URHE0023]